MSEENIDQIKHVNISEEIKSSFLDYAMSVIVQRALPDARDGMKPVQRRIMHGMNSMGVYNTSSFKKSARITGEVMGKYHPHGDSSIYEALVRMAQKFSYRYMLVQGQGNFGSIDGDGAAAQRYTEAKMSSIAMEMVRDIKKNTVDFIDNYDGEEQEPVVLPARFPNLLANGATGIAVGMATNIPTHNLGECINAAIAVLENPDITVAELMDGIIMGPDFPTGAQVLGKSGIRSYFETGRGSIMMRAQSFIEDMEAGKKRIVITELPYQVNKAELVRKIGELAREKQIDGITGLRDESSSEGIRVVIEVRKDIQPEVLLNQLYRLTPLQSSFGVNMLALVDNAPRVLTLKECLEVYNNHQIEVIERRTKYDLDKAKERAHIVEGLLIALDNIDEIVAILKSSRTDEIATEKFAERFNLSAKQSKAILDMQMRRLTGLQREKLDEEFKELEALIADLSDILANHERVLEILKNELLEVKEKFADKRRTEIVDGGTDMEDEDLIPVEDIIVTMTTNGYIKRNTVDTYRTQNRGGKGIKGMGMNEDDIVDQVLTMSTHDDLLCFTNFGKVYRTKGYRIPTASRIAKGIPVVNLLNLEQKEKVRSLVAIKKDNLGEYLFFVTKNGVVKRVTLEEFRLIRQNGKIAITLHDDDELFAVKETEGNNEIIIAASNGKAVRFNEDSVRPMGRTAAGVKGITMDDGVVVGLATNREGENLFVISAKGYGKKTAISDYRLTSRGTKGVITLNITDKTGDVVGIKAVKGDEDAIIATDNGVVIRISLNKVVTYGRNTQGVKLISVDDNSLVSTLEIVQPEEMDEEENSSVSE